MQTLTTKLPGGQRIPFKIAGSVLFIQAADQGQNLVVRFFTGNAQSGEVDQVGASFKAKPPTAFDGIDMLAPVDTNVTFIIADGDVDFQLPGLGVTVNNTGTNPVPVSIVSEPGAPIQVSAPPAAPVNVAVQGTVNVSGATLTATNVGINNTTANPVPTQAQPPGSTPADVAPVAVTTGGVPLITASAARKGLRVRNVGAGQLAITAAAGTTFANAAVVIQPGDTYIERDAPQAAWYAISDTGTTANIQTVS
ncbi:hypothetical protein G3O06_26930 [Burkholderia sp. Ac-20345]|uniref:hypothetical protein n=1 Tax=Burkholderia sp. Ac-20345 TaxID=2703891 RepID=UPI00197C8ECF|nr:hypothetical protein [Burkholderia sp. Ac-20345]MBN3781151.1 hypothetical protein [Burkholderia sp. Ac-20345]